uniref:Uncharacterized protein n=1 Tax=Echinococcus canadensis TaxID=519352 RepID=A0A915EZ79_9CEST
MAQQSRNRSQNHLRQPQSLESLYRTTQNFCNSIQRTLDTVCQQCMRLHINAEAERNIEVLERINAFNGDLKLDALSDVQCQLLVEDLDLNINESVVIGIVKLLRDLELLRKSAAIFFSLFSKRLSSMLDNGVYIFCVSLIELTQVNVNEVTEYNDFISKQRSELTEAANRIWQHRDRWNNLTMDIQSTMNNLEELRACLEDIQGEWNKIKVETNKWINQDREYPTRLANCINQHRKTMQDLLLEIEVISESEQQKTEERRHRGLRMEALQKRRRELCNNLRLVQHAKRFNATKLAAFNSVSAQTESARKECNSENSSTTGDGGKATDKIPFEEVCKFVALRVRHEWPRLYLNLPMWPTRSLNQRQDDITTLLGFGRMNVVLPRNRTSVEDATVALEKWRLLSRRYVDVDGLATGLTLAGWSVWAEEVRSRFGQEAGAAAESEKEASEVVEEAADTLAEEIFESETEVKIDLTIVNEETCLNEDECETSPKSLHDRSSKITEHQNWSRDSSTPKSIHRSSVDDVEKQVSLNDGSTTQEDDVMEALPLEKDVLDQESCTSEGILRKPFMRSSRSGSTERDDLPSNSSDIPLEQEELVDKSNYLSEKYKEEDSSNHSLEYISHKSSFSEDESAKKNDISQRLSRHDSQKDDKVNTQNQDANPYTRGESSKKSTRNDSRESRKDPKVEESLRSEKDEGTISRKKTSEGDQGRTKKSSTQKSLTSKKAEKQEFMERHLKDEESKQSDFMKTVETKKDGNFNGCSPPSPTKIGRFQTKDEKNENEQGTPDDKENTAISKSGSLKRDHMIARSNGQVNPDLGNIQGFDNFSKSDVETDLAKVEDDNSKFQGEQPIKEDGSARFNSAYSKKPSLSESADKDKDISEQLSKEDGPKEALVKNFQKSPPKSKVSLTDQRVPKNQKSTRSLMDKKKPHRISGKKAIAGNKLRQVERGGHSVEGSTSSEGELDKQVAGTSIGLVVSRKTSSVTESKEKLKNVNARGSEGSKKKRKKEK